MYESFFGLRDKPFSMTPDPRYLYLAESHEEALSALLYGIQERKGLITLTGPVGVGKTTILYSFFEQMRDRIEIAFFPGGFAASRIDFLRELCRLFHLEKDHSSQFEFTREIERFLSEKAGMGKNIVLLVDEAQDLSLEELNHFRFLNNLETPDVKFLQIILCGTGELEEKLRDPKVLSLRQRVAIRAVINPLDARSSVEYVHHRVAVAGGAAEDLFTPGAFWRIVNYAEGIPRKINVACDNALVIAFALKKPAVEEGFVMEALESLEGKKADEVRTGFVSREEVEALCIEAQRQKKTLRRAGTSSRVAEATESPPLQPKAPMPATPAPAPQADREMGPRSSAAEQGSEARWSRQPAPGTRAGMRPLSVAALVLVGLVIGALATFLVFREKGGQETRVAQLQPSAESKAEEGNQVRQTVSEGGDRALPAERSAGGSARGEPSREQPEQAQTGIMGTDLKAEMAAAPGREAQPAKGEKSPAGGPPAAVAASDAGEAAGSGPAAQGIAALMLQRYGELNPQAYAEIRKRNPEIEDLNRLTRSDQLVLPPRPGTAGQSADFYTVQAVTFFYEEAANLTADAFCSKGVQNVFVGRGRIGGDAGQEWYCCYIGLFGSPAEAWGWRDQVRQWGFYDAYVTRLQAGRLAEALHTCRGAG